MLFILGKIIAFTTLGLLVWFLGKEIQQILTLYFPWLRKIIGPLLILMGLMLAGIIKGRSFFSIKFIRKQNEVGSFLLGFFFSLAFCPTMFVLFFGTLIPLSFSSNYGYLFPTFFSIGTALPIVVLNVHHLLPWIKWDFTEKEPKNRKKHSAYSRCSPYINRAL